MRIEFTGNTIVISTRSGSEIWCGIAPTRNHLPALPAGRSSDRLASYYAAYLWRFYMIAQVMKPKALKQTTA